MRIVQRETVTARTGGSPASQPKRVVRKDAVPAPETSAATTKRPLVSISAGVS